MLQDIRGVVPCTIAIIFYGLLCVGLGDGMAYGQHADKYPNRKEAAIQQAFQALEFTSNKRIALKRSACATHKMGSIKADVEAQGTAFPDIAPYCMAVLKEAGKRGTLPQMYGMIEPLGKMEPWGKIFDAAKRNQPYYKSVSGKQEPIDCPLAFDAGYAGGYNQPHTPSHFTDFNQKRVQNMARACFDPSIESKTLSIDHKPAASAYIGFIAGYLTGQRDAKSILRTKE